MTTPQTVPVVQVYDYLLTPAGVAAPNEPISVQLTYAQATYSNPVVALSTLPVTTTTDANGYWTVSVAANDLINPSGTTYSVRTPMATYDINVASTAVPVGGWQSSAIAVNTPPPLGVAGFNLPGGTTVNGAFAVAGGATVGDLAVTGLTGAIQASRYVGATAYGAPSAGTFAVGDYVIGRLDSRVWVCTSAGTPGTWHSGQWNVYFARSYGAVFDGSTDDAGSIQNALDAAAVHGGQVIIDGTGKINSTPHAGAGLFVPNLVTLQFVGRGFNNTVTTNISKLFLGAGFPINTPMIRMDNVTPGFAFNTRLVNADLDCQDVVGSSGVFSSSLQNRSGIFNTTVRGMQAYGVKIVRDAFGSGAQEYVIDGLELIGTASTPSGCVPLLINGTNCGSPMGLNNISWGIPGQSIVTVQTAIQLDAMSCPVNAVIIEEAVDGFLLGSVAPVNGITVHPAAIGPNVTNAVHISAGGGSTTYTITGSATGGSGATTNAILDDVRGYASGVVPLGTYSVGPNGWITNVGTLPSKFRGLITFYKSGSGATISDSDFSYPADGMVAVLRDTGTSKSYLYIRAAGAWARVEAS